MGPGEVPRLSNFNNLQCQTSLTALTGAKGIFLRCQTGTIVRYSRKSGPAFGCGFLLIYFMHYNFVRIHQTLRVTPAMAAGVTGKLWEMADMVKVLEDWEATN